MGADLDRVLRGYRGVASRGQFFARGITRHELDNAVRRGALNALFPRTYCRPWDVDQLAIRERAALLSVGHPAALSHPSALYRWRLLDRVPDDIHVSVPVRRRPRAPAGVAVHRVERFPPVVMLHDLLTVDLAHSIVSSWPLLPVTERRGPAIAAVRQRWITTSALAVELDRLPRLDGRRELGTLIELLDAGCESELEIWGHLQVFDVPGLRHAARQKWVRVAGVPYRLDLAYEAEKVAVELDGAAYHSGRDQRERDVRRDAALASIGWLTLRYTHARLHSDVPGCRRDTLATLAARR